MLKLRFLLPVFLLLWMFGLSLSSAAQDSGGCPVLDTILTSVQEACSSLGPNEVCYGAGSVKLSPDGQTFAETGDKVDLSAIQTLLTGSAESEDWGIAMLKTLASLPDQTLTLVLFGGAEMTNRVDPNSGPAAALNLTNTAGYAVNLRAAPGTNAEVTGTLDKKASAVADGRNAAGDWFRIQTGDGPAWVAAKLVTLDGDPKTLAVMDNPYTQPMQAFTLTTHGGGNSGCAPSGGLLVQLSGQKTAHIQVNSVDLALSDATLLLQAQPGSELQIQVMSGSVEVTAQNSPVKAGSGASVHVNLGGESGLEPVNTPEVSTRYPFAAVDGAPVNLLPNSELACVVGLSANESLTSYAGPGPDYKAVSELSADGHFVVTGWAAGGDNQDWWKVDTGRTTVWVPQNSVRALGACQKVVKVEAPSLSTTSNTSDAVSSVSLVPAGQSVWQANSGLDNVSGTCTAAPLALCSHLVAIIPNTNGTLTWRGQEPLPYTLSPAGPNTYSFSGRSVLGNGNVSLTLTFVDQSSWKMTFQTVFDSDPACTHTFYYTATRNW